jgi:aminoglycoside 6'-N-acetyltransferase
VRTPDVPLVGRSSIVRPATTDDADLLVAWHEDPDVSRYWDGKTFTRAQMMLHLVRADIDPYVVMDEDVPVGYIQVWFEEDVPGAGGLDMFLIPPARDRGLGPDAARTLARWLLTNGIVHRLTTDRTFGTRGRSRRGRRRDSSRSKNEAPTMSTTTRGY